MQLNQFPKYKLNYYNFNYKEVKERMTYDEKIIEINDKLLKIKEKEFYSEWDNSVNRLLVRDYGVKPYDMRRNKKSVDSNCSGNTYEVNEKLINSLKEILVDRIKEK